MSGARQRQTPLRDAHTHGCPAPTIRRSAASERRGTSPGLVFHVKRDSAGVRARDLQAPVRGRPMPSLLLRERLIARARTPSSVSLRRPVEQRRGISRCRSYVCTAPNCEDAIESPTPQLKAPRTSPTTPRDGVRREARPHGSSRVRHTPARPHRAARRFSPGPSAASRGDSPVGSPSNRCTEEHRRRRRPPRGTGAT